MGQNIYFRTGWCDGGPDTPPAPETIMADRDDKNSNRGFASMDKETREQAARKGGEASHKSSTAKSLNASSGAHNENGSGPGSNRSRAASRGGEHSHGGHGSSSGGSSSSSRSSRD